MQGEGSNRAREVKGSDYTTTPICEVFFNEKMQGMICTLYVSKFGVISGESSLGQGGATAGPIFFFYFLFLFLIYILHVFPTNVNCI
jgi:hypothetical protein